MARIAHSAVQLLALLLCASAWAQSANNEGQPRVQKLWENAAPSNLPSDQVTLPLSLIDLAQLSNGSAALLVSDSHENKALFLGANESGPGLFVPLPQLAAAPASGLRLVKGIANDLWIGGASNFRESLFAGGLSDAYLAKLNGQGKLVWERTFDVNIARKIWDIAALPNGDVVVAGRVDNKTWLARISTDGHLVWERTFARGYMAAVAIVGGRIAVVAFDSDGEGIWRFNDDGNPVDHFIIEKLEQPPQPFWRVRLFGGNPDGGFYTFSLWSETFHPRESLLAHPLKVLKLDAHGHTVWRKELSQAALQGLDVAPPVLERRSEFCMPIIGVLQNSNPVIACPVTGAVVVSEINALGGELKQIKANRPPSLPCSTGRSWPNLIEPKSNKMVWLFGAGRCTWLDQVPLAE